MGEVSGEKLDSVRLNLQEGEGVSNEVLATPVVLTDPESGIDRAVIMLGSIPVAATMSGGEARTLQGETVRYWPPGMTVIHDQKSGSLHVFKCE